MFGVGVWGVCGVCARDALAVLASVMSFCHTHTHTLSLAHTHAHTHIPSRTNAPGEDLGTHLGVLAAVGRLTLLQGLSLSPLSLSLSPSVSFCLSLSRSLTHTHTLNPKPLSKPQTRVVYVCTELVAARCAIKKTKILCNKKMNAQSSWRLVDLCSRMISSQVNASLPSDCTRLCNKQK